MKKLNLDIHLKTQMEPEMDGFLRSKAEKLTQDLIEAQKKKNGTDIADVGMESQMKLTGYIFSLLVAASSAAIELPPLLANIFGVNRDKKTEMEAGYPSKEP